MAGTANNGGEDSPGGVITSKTSLAHARAIVNDKSSNVFVTHVGLLKIETLSHHNSQLRSEQKSRVFVRNH